MNVSLNTGVLIPKISSKAAAGTKQAEQSKTADNPSFKGANLLSEINKMLITPHKNGDEELAELIKKEYSEPYILKLIGGKLPSDEALVFIAKNFIDADKKSAPKSLYMEIRTLGVVIQKFNELSEEQIEKILNSKFISVLMNNSGVSDGFKFSCLDLSPEVIDRFEPLTENALTKHCIESFFKTGNYDELTEERLEKFSNILVPVNVFNEYNKAPEKFYDLLLQRDSDDISEIAKILNKIEITDDKEFGELHSVLKTLLEAKTPDGNIIFGSNEASDRTSKTMMSGIANILNAKYNSPEKFEKLMNLLQLTKEGKIPPFVLGTLAEKAEITPEIFEAAEELQKGITPEIKNSTDLDNCTFNELFPKIETIALSQGQLGNCYFVSAVYDFLNNEKGREKIFNMFKQDGNDIIVTIPDAEDFPVRFKNKVILQDCEKHIKGALGIQMLEEAYKQTRALKYGTAGEMTSIEGGMQVNVYNAFTGSMNAKSYQIKSDSGAIPSKAEIKQQIKEAEENIKKLKSEVKNLEDSDRGLDHLMYIADQLKINDIHKLQAYQRAMHEALTQIDNFKIIEDDKLIEKLLEVSNCPNNIISIGSKCSGDCFDKSKLIYAQHAYSVRNIDKNAQTIDIVNPWNTASYVTITFDEFKKYFSALNIVTIT